MKEKKIEIEESVILEEELLLPQISYPEEYSETNKKAAIRIHRYTQFESKSCIELENLGFIHSHRAISSNQQ